MDNYTVYCSGNRHDLEEPGSLRSQLPALIVKYQSIPDSVSKYCNFGNNTGEKLLEVRIWNGSKKDNHTGRRLPALIA